MPFITVITSTLNVLPLLRHTAASIWEQTYSDMQWIIVDGASTDGTVEWLKENCAQRLNCSYITEPDEGIYDAFNKALPLIQGEWVIFLGAGDTLADLHTLEKCVGLLSNVSAYITIAYGGVLWINHINDKDGYLCYEHWRGLDGPWIAARPAMPSHQGVFHRSILFKQGFRFDTRFRIAADGELVIRELLGNRGSDLGVVVAHMLQGGTSTNRLNKLRLVKESIHINSKLGIFWHRPFLQVAVLASNILKHPFRVFRNYNN